MDKVSVIIPIYNREKYINRCLDSVLNQTYSNIEVICVDDKSTDESLEICYEYQRKDDRVKVVALEKNGGVSNARNTGIKNATGEWIAFVDSDDTIESDMLSEMMGVIANTGVDIVLSDLDMFSGGKSQNMKISIEPERVYNRAEIHDSILPRFTHDGSDNLGLFAFSTKLFRKSIIVDNSISFDTSIAYEEDKLFVIEALANCNNLYYIPKAYYHYDTSSGGLYSAFNKKAWAWYVNSYFKFKGLIKDYQINNANPKYLANSFIYNITWFLYRSQRIDDSKRRKELQKTVINDNRTQEICSQIVNMLTSFDRRMAKAILSKNRWKAITIIDFVYSGKKDNLLKILRR